ncbi:MAG TPA: TolC family protein, partial [Candidatus Saccharimonadales bacterium]|nr:TolC family protein [Candidatus Saccharimonadales bacterium]
LLAQQRALAAGRQDVREAQAGVRPQIDLRATGVLIDEDRAASSFGQQPQRTLSAGVRLNQLLWSNRAFGNVGVQADIQRSRESGYEASRMDVVLEATQAFLDVLRAQTLERIRRQNARLTEDNLRLAERRRDLGAGGPADVYRWRSQLATDRQDAIAARQRVEIARALLNRILHRPIEEPFAAETPDLLDPSLVTGQGRLRPYIDDPWSFEVFRDFMVADGLVRAPELEALDASIEAAQASRRIAVRSLWAPDIALFGDLSERLATGGAGSDPALPLPGLRRADDRDWSLGLQASFPLFSGGAKWAHLRRSSETLQELRLQRKAAEERIELRIRTSLFRIASSSPAIGLSREAAGAARQNLDLVRDAYSRGSVPILDLLDAQNAALVADQVASNAVFDFLIDLMEVQRATVNYDFFRSSEEREAWFRKVDDYFESAGPPRPSEGGER